MLSSRSILVTFFIISSNAFTPPQRHKSLKRTLRSAFYKDEENEEEGFLYNDFGDFVVGGGDENALNSAMDDSLQNRFNQLVEVEKENELRIEGNWLKGHWSVRGCSLDPGMDDEKTLVSYITGIDDSDVVLVGRTDGSICWLQLGDEYLATFVNQLVAREGENDSIQVTEGLKREDQQASSSQAPTPFQVLGQIHSATGKGSITEIVFSEPYLFSVNAATNGLEFWEISEDGPVSQSSTVLATLPSPVISLKIVTMGNQSFLVCICKDGQAMIWKVGESKISFLTVKNLLLDSLPSGGGGDAVLSFDSDSQYLYLGTEKGIVLIFPISDILNTGSDQSDLSPLKSFPPFVDGKAGISAIAAAGKGSMSTSQQHTVGLIIGGTNGKIKQYELIPRGENGLEYWPKMETQTIPGKKHLFNTNTFESSNDGPVLAFHILPKLVLAATSSELTMWNPIDGEALFGMQGLDFSMTKPSLVVHDSDSLLITNGMEHLVCLHDFSAEDLDIDEMIERDDDSS